MLCFLPGFGTSVTPPPVVTETPLGGKGDNELRRIVKPTGLVDRPKLQVPLGRKTIDERVDQSGQIAAEITARLAREFGEQAEAELLAIEEMSQAQIAAEIGARLKKKIREQELKDEEDLMIRLAMISSVS